MEQTSKFDQQINSRNNTHVKPGRAADAESSFWDGTYCCLLVLLRLSQPLTLTMLMLLLLLLTLQWMVTWMQREQVFQADSDSLVGTAGMDK